MPSNLALEPGSPPTQQIDEVFKSRMDRLRLRHLRLLDMVARTGSLSAASHKLDMSQPGATKMLQELEQAFGCALIERSAKGGELTEAGKHVLDRMRIALQAIRTARTSVDLRKEKPLVRLGIIPLVGIHALSEVVGAMQSGHTLPRLQIQLGTVESLIQALSEGRVDAVVSFLDETASLSHISKFQVTPLWDERLVVVASSTHPLARRKKVSLEMAMAHEWVLMPKPSSNRRAVERLFLGAGLTPPIPHIETESFHIGLSLVASSQMLSAAPQSAYQQYKPQVCVLPMEVPFPATNLVFLTLADGPALPAVKMIADRFQAYAEHIRPKPLRALRGSKRKSKFE
jgi:molybdate transport repressor ModE-like protein